MASVYPRKGKRGGNLVCFLYVQWETDKAQGEGCYN